jgi:hypothetical protein
MKYQVEQFSFKEDKDYLDVEVHHEEGWIELKMETTNRFPVQSQKDLDFIYQKLSEVFSSFEES